MNWHITRFPELRSPDMQDAEFQVNIGSVQTQGFVSRAVLAGMMDDDSRQVVSALQGTQIAENRGDLAGLVFVHLMQAHNGVQE
jgi:hypothetical protein